MLFTGTSDLIIDSKGRLTLPAKHRDQAGREMTTWFCVPWPGVGLRLYPQSTFQELSRSLGGTLLPNSAEAELHSTFFSLAEELQMDAQGRLPLPKHLLDLVSLSNTTEVSVIGVQNRLEVRDRAQWAATLKSRFEAMAINVNLMPPPQRPPSTN